MIDYSNEELKKKIDQWIEASERMGLSEYVAYMSDKKRRLTSHFLGGLARGVGMAIGFTLLGALLIWVLQDLAKRNLPLIGDFLAQIVTIVQNNIK